MNRKNVILIIVGILVIVAAGFWYWQSKKATPAVPVTSAPAPTLGGQISEKLQNPISGKLPETNPFENQKNPFDAIYQNPFK